MNHGSLLQNCFLFDPHDPGSRERRRDVRTAILAFFLTYCMLHWMSGANAQGMFGNIVGTFDTQSKTWLSDLASAGKTAFIALAGIEITWCAMLWAFEKDSMTGMMGDLVKSIMTIGFFYMILINAPDWIPIIHEQFTSLSASTIKAPTLTVDGIIGYGIRGAIFIWVNLMNPVNIFAGVAAQLAELTRLIVEMLAKIVASGGLSLVVTGGAELVEPLTQIGMIILWGFSSWCISGLISLVVLICYFIIALQLLMLQVEMGLLMAAGAVLLGLGGSRWTRDYVQKYLNHALVTGIRFLVLMMVLTVTMAGLEATPWDATGNALEGMAQGFTGGGGDENQALLVAISGMGILFTVLIKTFLAIKAPDLAGALFSGGSALTASSVSDTVMGAVGAAATVMGLPAGAVGAAEGLGTLSRGELGKHFAGDYKPAGKSDSKPSGAVAGL